MKDKLYLPRKYWSPMAFRVLLVVELPFTVVVLALFGIASPNLYRKKLWQDGADNGFNSSPIDQVYAFSNYRPYTIPRPWAQFTTNFNLIISVLSMFFLLVKAPMFMMNVFYPPLSLLVHCTLTALYIVAAVFQAGRDTSDPKHPQNGAPWYITKNCNVAAHRGNIGYCRQAKSAFAFTIIMSTIFAAHIVLAALSCSPTADVRERQREKLERREMLEELKSLKSPLNPTGLDGFAIATPRTAAFNTLSGIPLRVQTDMAQGGRSLSDVEEAQEQVQQVPEKSNRHSIQSIQVPEAPMYFPPPPTKASK